MSLKVFRYLVVLISLITISSALHAQNEIVHIYGQLRDESTKKKLDGCTVTVFKDGAMVDTYDTGTSGKYDLTLKLGHNYDIRFSKDGYLPKIIRLDTRNIPEEERYGGFDMNVMGTLFPEREGFNTDLLKEPLAIAKYMPNADGFMFDSDYSDKKAAMIAAEHKRLDELAKNFEKLKKQFEDLMKEGDKKMAESKYSDAMDKFQAALNLFPKDEKAKAKYNDAKARLEAENANKEFEAKYKQLMAEADKLYADKRYEEAKKKYQEASAMKKDERLPKEGIYNCDQALKDLVKRKEYDAIIADADAKFMNKDYAVSIEKYKEALTKYPNEPYPKDQIVKAELALRAMLDEEAARLAKRKEYDAKIKLAADYESADNLEKAISTYREAGYILPEEKLPPTKISELEKLLAERKRKNDELAKNNAEAEKLEKEYNELIKQADNLFLAKNYTESRAAYVSASGLKPEAAYPKTRIETIDLLLKEDAERLAKLRQKAVEDSLNALKSAELEEMNRRKLELQRQAEEEAEARRRYQEEERLAALNKLNSSKERGWNSQADAEAEDEVEQYYRDAKAKEDAARNHEIAQRIRENNSFHNRKSSSQAETIAERQKNIEAEKKAMVDLADKGHAVYSANVNENEKQRQRYEKQLSDAEVSANNRISRTQNEIANKQKDLNAISQNDRQRAIRVAENERLKNQVKRATEDAQRHGDILRRDNQNAIERQKAEQNELAYKGELQRQEKQESVEQEIKKYKNTTEDKSKATHERLKNVARQQEINRSKIDNGGEKSQQVANERNKLIEQQKAALALEKNQREIAEAQRHFETRKALNNVKSGPKQTSEENLAEGVTENSYKFGNKMITERTVTVGNKVDTYKKVVSKTAIYYFKNGYSITEATWKKETLSNR